MSGWWVCKKLAVNIQKYVKRLCALTIAVVSLLPCLLLTDLLNMPDFEEWVVQLIVELSPEEAIWICE